MSETERLNGYAAAIHRGRCDREPCRPSAEEIKTARAAMLAADQEQAELRAKLAAVEALLDSCDDGCIREALASVPTPFCPTCRSGGEPYYARDGRALCTHRFHEGRTRRD